MFKKPWNEWPEILRPLNLEEIVLLVLGMGMSYLKDALLEEKVISLLDYHSLNEDRAKDRHMMLDV